MAQSTKILLFRLQNCNFLILGKFTNSVRCYFFLILCLITRKVFIYLKKKSQLAFSILNFFDGVLFFKIYFNLVVFLKYHLC